LFFFFFSEESYEHKFSPLSNHKIKVIPTSTNLNNEASLPTLSIGPTATLIDNLDITAASLFHRDRAFTNSKIAATLIQ
jgi:hypothetical protein